MAASLPDPPRVAVREDGHAPGTVKAQVSRARDGLAFCNASFTCRLYTAQSTTCSIYSRINNVRYLFCLHDL